MKHHIDTVSTIRTLVAALALSVTASAVAGGAVAAVTPEGRTIVVAAVDGDAMTIADGIAMAGDGDIVSVHPGVYVESLVITTNMTLAGIGEGVVVETLPGAGPAVTTRDADVIVRELTFRGEGSAVVSDGGTLVLERLVFEGVRRSRGTNLPRIAIVIGGDADATIIDSELKDSGDILVRDLAAARLEDNTLEGSSGILIAGAGARSLVIGNHITGARLHGIEIRARGQHRIESNTIIAAESSGISVGNGRSGGVDPFIRDNVVQGSSFGISVANLAEPTIIGNDIIGNDVGISTAVSDARIESNRIADGGVGLVTTRHAPVLSDNLVEGNVIGLLVALATDPVLNDNVICMNGTNLRLLTGAPQPDVSGNTVCPDE